MDTRIQRFLGQGKSYKDREDVNEKLVNFEDISENSLNQCFNVTLPIAFQLKVNKDDNSNKHLMLNSPDKKRKRRESRPSIDLRVQNTSQLEEFKMKPNENWKDNFAGKLPRERPFWDRNKTGKYDCKMCARFHINGDCFDDCNNKESHVSADKIPADRKNAMKEYMKKVRKN